MQHLVSATINALKMKKLKIIENQLARDFVPSISSRKLHFQSFFFEVLVGNLSIHSYRFTQSIFVVFSVISKIETNLIGSGSSFLNINVHFHVHI